MSEISRSLSPGTPWERVGVRGSRWVESIGSYATFSSLMPLSYPLDEYTKLDRGLVAS